MKRTKITVLACAVWLAGVCPASMAQTPDCKTLENVGLDGLVSYLSDTLPNEGNADCVTFAIDNIARYRYEPAINALTRLLDFRRPPSALEKLHYTVHLPSIDYMYPAADALEEIAEVSKKGAPAVLEAIRSSSSSTTARENAVYVWMDIHRRKPSTGIRLLRQEAIATADPAVKENLKWALSRAPTWCLNPKDKVRCRAAATIAKP
jgi:hypothetical protein